ncbi:MAG: hypothetical protein AAFY60_21595, partial [Myxococcota bacterium]
MTTIAGTGGSGFDGDGPATQRTVSAPSDVSTDGARVLFADSGSGRLRTAEAGRLTSLTGDQPKAEPALRSAFVQPGDCVYDNAGRITVIDGDVLRRFDPARGTLTRIAGNGTTDGPLGDDGPATAGRLNSPSGLAFDGEGGLWVADRANHRIRRIDPTTGVITTVAGGNRGNDDGPALLARFDEPADIALDADLGLYIADRGNHLLRYLSFETGAVSTVAGNGAPGYVDGPALNAQLNRPDSVAVGLDGAVYIFDAENAALRRYNYNSRSLETIAGDGVVCSSSGCGDGGSPRDAQFGGRSGSLAVTPTGSILVADQGVERIREISIESDSINSIAGGGD